MGGPAYRSGTCEQSRLFKRTTQILRASSDGYLTNSAGDTSPNSPTHTTINTLQQVLEQTLALLNARFERLKNALSSISPLTHNA